MDKSVQITLIIVTAVIVLALIGVAVYTQSKPGNTINVQGISQVKAIPDLVTIYFNVQTEGKDAKEAKDKNAEIVDNAIINLIKLGFERKEITTQDFNIWPEYDWRNGEREIKGYRASHTLKIEMSTDKADKIGDAIDAGVDAGAGVSYINFELSLEKQNEYKALALKQATEDARIKAESIASGLGKSLGKVVSISASEFDYYPWGLYEETGGGVAMAKEATTNIQPGEQDITGRVSVVFRIV